jgi:hypothetical protein
MRTDDLLSFKGYRLNQKGVILGKINPLLLPPLMGIFFFPWLPVRIVFFTLMCAIFVLDYADIRPSEAMRGLMFKFVKRIRVVSCSITHENKINNLKRMGL